MSVSEFRSVGRNRRYSGTTQGWFSGQASGYDWICRTTRIAIYIRDEWKCIACGSAEALTLDHFDPAGDNKPTNLVTLCCSCNSSRRSTKPSRWNAEYAKAARAQLRKPLDRKTALAIAKSKWPARYANQAKKKAEARMKRKAVATPTVPFADAAEHTGQTASSPA